jgi:hypothetical protein
VSAATHGAVAPRPRFRALARLRVCPHYGKSDCLSATPLRLRAKGGAERNEAHGSSRRRPSRRGRMCRGAARRQSRGPAGPRS